MLKCITLHLARDNDFPDGSSERGYAITAPLDEVGHLDATAWKKLKNRCEVRRFWRGEEDRVGRLVHQPGGKDGATWKIHYRDADESDETGYRLGAHRFLVNEYVSIHDESGRSHTFKIANIRPA